MVSWGTKKGKELRAKKETKSCQKIQSINSICLKFIITKWPKNTRMVNNIPFSTGKTDNINQTSK